MGMRHIVRVLVFLMCLAIPMASLAEIDLSSMSYEELLSLQKQVSQELRLKEPVNGDLIYDKGGIRIFYQGIKADMFTGAQFLIENASDKNIGVSFEDVSVNDFMTNVLFSATVSKGKKAIDTLDFIYLDDLGITTIENIELSVQIFDSSSYMTIDRSDPVVIVP